MNRVLDSESPLPRPSAARFARPAPGGESPLLAQAIAAAQQQDPEALRFLYVRYSDDVRNYVSSIIRDGDAAEDVTQTIFSQLLRKIRHFQDREVPFKGWLVRVAHNAAIDHLRSRRVIPFEEIHVRDARFDETGIERARSLRAALERLSPEQREVVVLRQIAGLTPPEIALRLGKSESAVNGLHYRARSALRASLSEMGAAPATAAQVRAR